MASIVGCEDELMPEESEEETGESEVIIAEEEYKCGEKEAVTRYFYEVGGIRALIEALSSDTIVESAVFLDDEVL